MVPGSTITRGMKKHDLMNGLGFLMGSLDMLETSFLRNLRRELTRFRSVPRSEEELRQFQSKLYQSLVVFTDLSEMVSENRGEDEVFNELRGMLSEDKGEDEVSAGLSGMVSEDRGEDEVSTSLSGMASEVKGEDGISESQPSR